MRKSKIWVIEARDMFMRPKRFTRIIEGDPNFSHLQAQHLYQFRIETKFRRYYYQVLSVTFYNICTDTDVIGVNYGVWAVRKF